MSLHRNPLNGPDPTTGTTTQTVQLLLFLQLPVMPHPPDTIDVLVLWGVNPMQRQIKRIGVGTWCPCLSKPSLSAPVLVKVGGWVGRKGGAVMKTSLMVKITQSDLSPWNAGRPVLPVAWLPGVTRVITPSLGLSFICTILQIKSSLTILCHKRWVITAGKERKLP